MSENLTSRQRLDAFIKLGEKLAEGGESLGLLIRDAPRYNPWFTPENVFRAIGGIGIMLTEADLKEWASRYDLDGVPAKKVGLILAGNIPMVGFHDVLCVLLSGHVAQIKLSSQDQHIMPHILDILISIESRFRTQIEYVDRLKDFDAVIATGSNNSARYFDYYFARVPHIIRKNRSSAAILTGNESSDQLSALGHDIFDYFGLGCRNVSKLFVPKGYDFQEFFEAISHFASIKDHHKYANNYDYNKSIFLVNLDPHLDNGFVLLKPDTRLASPLAVVYYEEYEDTPALSATLHDLQDDLQCVVGDSQIGLTLTPFGQSQTPRVGDYADGVDTMAFLTGIVV